MRQPPGTRSITGVNLDTELDTRPLQDTAISVWAALLAEIEAEDHEEEIVGEDDLAEEFTDPNADFARGSVAVYRQRNMIAYGVLGLRSSAETVHNMRFRGGVHPSYRRRAIGSWLLEWAERTAPSLHHERFGGLPLSLTGRFLSRDRAAAALYSGRGYQPSRWYHAMTCDLSGSVTPVNGPSGVRISAFTPASAADALLVRNEAFRDHWDSTELTPEDWNHFLRYQAFRPAFSFVAYAEDEPVGLIIGHEYDAYNKAMGVRDLNVALVGTRKAWRGRGIAAALIASALTAGQADGCTSAALSVDADSLTGAVGVYERVGFTIKDTWVEQRKGLATG